MTSHEFVRIQILSVTVAQCCDQWVALQIYQIMVLQAVRGRRDNSLIFTLITFTRETWKFNVSFSHLIGLFYPDVNAA